MHEVVAPCYQQQGATTPLNHQRAKLLQLTFLAFKVSIRLEDVPCEILL